MMHQSFELKGAPFSFKENDFASAIAPSTKHGCLCKKTEDMLTCHINKIIDFIVFTCAFPTGI